MAKAFETPRRLFLLAAVILIWLFFLMVFFERLVSPFDRLIPYLMPWKMLNAIPAEAGLGERLSFMQSLLDSSKRVADYSFAVMVVSFAMFSMYLTMVYQQKQRKTQENRLLVLKNREIARRNEFIRYISATIGHEFKNNLGRIKRRLDLLPDLPPDASRHIYENFDKLFADIDIFKRISDEREAGLIDFSRIDLREMLRSLAAQFSDLARISLLEDGGLEFHPPVIFASGTLLKTVFENLIDNSIKYKKPEQKLALISISFSSDTDGNRRYVSISFRDEGVGMDEIQADGCFYKGKKSAEGWGEGLYFAKYVVGLHAGKIRVGKEYTKYGAGTEIIINLPYVEESLYV